MSMPVEPPADDRSERMLQDPDGYFTDARERREAEVLAERAGRRVRSRRNPRSKPTPGVVQLQVRMAREQDAGKLVDRLRSAGCRVWFSSPETVTHSDGVLCRYLVVDLGKDEA